MSWRFDSKYRERKKGDSRDPIDYNKLPCYADLINQGYEHGSNCSAGEVDKYSRMFRLRGLEIIVRNDAYHRYNKRLIKGWKAIFVRKKR